MADASTSTPAGWLGQALLYALFALIIGVFSSWPPYRYLQPDQALIKLSFNHQGKPVSDCRRATPQELAKLPANMRAPEVCPRERSPIAVELDLDGATALRHVATPSGLSRDGASAFYQRMLVPAGTHQLVIRLKDDVRSPGFDFVREATVNLKSAQILVIDFDPGKGGITLQ
ncbi:MAG: hypothetical protein ABI777_05000 [Betaproteobacteria bacterium]